MTMQMTTKRETVGQLRAPVAVPEAPEHLKAIASGSLVTLVALMFWKLRNQYPDFAVTFTEHDIKGMQDSMQYTEQAPKLWAKAAQTYVAFGVKDESTGDMIRVEENNEADLDIKEQARKVRRIKESAGNLVATARTELSQGITSNDTINTLCEGLLALAKE